MPKGDRTDLPRSRDTSPEASFSGWPTLRESHKNANTNTNNFKTTSKPSTNSTYTSKPSSANSSKPSSSATKPANSPANKLVSAHSNEPIATSESLKFNNPAQELLRAPSVVFMSSTRASRKLKSGVNRRTNRHEPTTISSCLTFVIRRTEKHGTTLCSTFVVQTVSPWTEITRSALLRPPATPQTTGPDHHGTDTDPPCPHRACATRRPSPPPDRPTTPQPSAAQAPRQRSEPPPLPARKKSW